MKMAPKRKALKSAPKSPALSAFGKIPQEVWSHIYKKLDPITALSLSLSSRKLYCRFQKTVIIPDPTRLNAAARQRYRNRLIAPRPNNDEEDSGDDDDDIEDYLRNQLFGDRYRYPFRLTQQVRSPETGTLTLAAVLAPWMAQADYTWFPVLQIFIKSDTVDNRLPEVDTMAQESPTWGQSRRERRKAVREDKNEQLKDREQWKKDHATTVADINAAMDSDADTYSGNSMEGVAHSAGEDLSDEWLDEDGEVRERIDVDDLTSNSNSDQDFLYTFGSDTEEESDDDEDLDLNPEDNAKDEDEDEDDSE